MNNCAVLETCLVEKINYLSNDRLIIINDTDTDANTDIIFVIIRVTGLVGNKNIIISITK